MCRRHDRGGPATLHRRYSKHRIADSEAGLGLQSSASSGLPALAMIANSACNVPFRYFRSGKIFMFEANDVWTHRLCP